MVAPVWVKVRSSGPRVYSKRKGAEPPPPDAVLVDRNTRWGNPFVMRGEWDRERVIREFRAYALQRREEEPDWLKPLRGKDLVCWCFPSACHADILIELANTPGADE